MIFLQWKETAALIILQKFKRPRSIQKSNLTLIINIYDVAENVLEGETVAYKYKCIQTRPLTKVFEILLS